MKMKKRPSTTRQGVPDLNKPRNGKRETPTGAPQPALQIYSVCEHEWEQSLDDFGLPEGYTCRRCGVSS